MITHVLYHRTAFVVVVYYKRCIMNEKSLYVNLKLHSTPPLSTSREVYLWKLPFIFNLIVVLSRITNMKQFNNII